MFKSTNAGEAWSDLGITYGPLGTYFPVVLTGSTGDKLYLFYLRSSQNGDIQLQRFTQSGAWDGSFDVKVDSDTITYFSACTDLGRGDYLMVAYQKEELGDYTPDLYSIVSTDQGENWSTEVKITEDGSHPDIAYGNDGYVYCVHEKTGGPDTQIGFIRSSDYGISWELGTGKYLTSGLHDDTYPKIAALHSLPDSTPNVWVAYNHDWGNGDIDLHFAYSTNGGAYWVSYLLAGDNDYDEMACDLWAREDGDYSYVSICYLKDRLVMPSPHSYIVYGWADMAEPTDWHSPIGINSYFPARSQDGREVCQGTYAKGNCAIIYAGYDFPYGDNFENLYCDTSAFPTDVEEEMTEEEVPAEFSLSANYPNPFNPVTSIQYAVGSRQKPIPTTLKIYNVLGQLVRILVNEPKEAGTYEVNWDGRDENGNEVASGVYLYRLQVRDFTQTKKMVLMK